MPQRVDNDIHGLSRDGVHHWNLDGVILAARRGEVGLKRCARGELNGTRRREIRGARIKDGRVTEALPARNKGELILIELLVGEQLVSSGSKVGEAKLAIGPGPKCVRRHPMLLSFADFAAVQLQEGSHVSFRSLKVDMPHDQRLRTEIKGDLRLVYHRAAVGRVILELQKTGLARLELSRPVIWRISAKAADHVLL